MTAQRLTVPLALSPLPPLPLVSVLVASYNYAAYLGAALASLQAQTYARFEVIICDDGSTDDSRAVAGRVVAHDARFRLLEKENGGVASALNAAYDAARGAIIVLLDADDLAAPEKLERLVACFRERPAAGLALHALQMIDGNGRGLGQLPATGAFEEGWLAARVRARGGRWRSLPAGALGFRREVAERLFPIPEAMFRSEADGFLLMLAPLLTRVAARPEVLGCYRLHGANLTGTRRLDGRAAARALDALARKTDAVNARLDALGVEGPPLRLDDHLNAREQSFTLALLDGTPRAALLRAYVDLARALLADDLYAGLRKAAGLFAYAKALVLPVAAREAWLNFILGPGGLRRLLG